MTIIQQYFESILTKSGTETNLFFFKPPFTRNDSYNLVQENMTSDERISYIVDLVAHAQNPFLIRLSAAYRTTIVDAENSTTNEIIIPITSLPTSFAGCTEDGTKFDIEQDVPTVDGVFPIHQGNTKVYLQVVCLNMSRSSFDDYPVIDGISNPTSE